MLGEEQQILQSYNPAITDTINIKYVLRIIIIILVQEKYLTLLQNIIYIKRWHIIQTRIQS